MNDGVYKGFPLYYHDAAIMSCESMLSIFDLEIDSLEYLEKIQHADIIKK